MIKEHKMFALFRLPLFVKNANTEIVAQKNEKISLKNSSKIVTILKTKSRYASIKKKDFFQNLKKKLISIKERLGKKLMRTKLHHIFTNFSSLLSTVFFSQSTRRYTYSTSPLTPLPPHTRARKTGQKI